MAIHDLIFFYIHKIKIKGGLVLVKGQAISLDFSSAYRGIYKSPINGET